MNYPIYIKKCNRKRLYIVLQKYLTARYYKYMNLYSILLMFQYNSKKIMPLKFHLRHRMLFNIMIM